MSNKEFAFPPPPPPPPKKDAMTGGNFGYGRGNKGGSFNRGSNRGGGSRPSGRGFGGEAPRGNSFSNQREGRAYSSNGPISSNSSFIGHREWSQGYSNTETPASSYGARQSQSQPGPRPTSSSGTNHWNAPQKRDHAKAFNHRGRGGSKPPAAPAVPSFLANIPGLSPSTPSDILPGAPKIPAEKKRKARTSNILGLNPSMQGPESDEDDEDEEANPGIITTSGVAFEYNGRVATLKTPDEIAAWIADRKKRFPTAAKAAHAKEEAQEKQKKWEEEKKANQEARRLQRESYEQEKAAKLQAVRGQKVAGRLNPTETVKDNGEWTDKVSDAAEKARLKTEKLIKKAAKAQKKLTKAQEALKRAQGVGQMVESTQSTAEGSNDQVMGDVLTGGVVSQIASEDQPVKLSPTIDDSDVSSILTSDGEDDEATSSSGSSSDSSSDSDSDAAPEVLTTKRKAPDRVAPPPRVPASTTSTSTQLISCRNMMKYGRCNAGPKCRFSHDPNQEVEVVMQTRSRKRKEIQVTGRPKRKGLWEVMVEKEKEEEARAVLRVIVEMGEKGMLGDRGGD